MKIEQKKRTRIVVILTACVALTAGATSPTPNISNVAYVENANANQWLDVYIAEGAEGGDPTPLYIWSHWNGGTAKDVPTSLWEELSSAGISLISWESVIDVHTEAQFYDATDDMNLVLDFVVANASIYNIDTNKIFVGGQSRGSGVSWIPSQERDELVKGIYSAQALPDGFWELPTWIPIDDIHSNSPPVFLTYEKAPDTTDPHTPLHGMAVTNRYGELGIGERAFLIHSLDTSLLWDYIVDFIEMVLAPDTSLIFEAVEDGSTKEARPDATTDWLMLRSLAPSSYSRLGYIKFDVTGLSSDATQAVLRVYSQTLCGALEAYDASNNWSESTLTWNASPTVNALLDTVTAISNNWVELDVSDAVTSNGTYTIALESMENVLGRLSSIEEINPPELIVYLAADWDELSTDDFESGMGNWADGGADVALSSANALGTQCVDLQDDSGDDSSVWLNSSLDLSGCEELKLEFSYLPVSMDNAHETFDVLYSDGTNWIQVSSYVLGVDFDNDTREYEELILSADTLNFTSDANIKFRCNASGDWDDVYLDNITVSAR